MNARIKRLLRKEDGFTLSEMLVTMMLMTIVLFALYNIFDASIRVFSFGNDKVEAVENARLGLEKMERELRACADRLATFHICRFSARSNRLLIAH